MAAKKKTASSSVNLLTPATIEILKNLATINETLLFPPGNLLVTRSVKKHTYAEVTVSETFPLRPSGEKIVVYDLNQFLSVVTQFEKPTLNFEAASEYMVISDEVGGMSVKFHYGDESLAYTPDPNKKIELPSTEVAMQLTEKDSKQIINMARTLGTPELAIESDGKNLKLVARDIKNTSTNTTELLIGKSPDSTPFSFVWKIEYLKLLPGTYDLAVSKEGLSRFKHTSLPITYHIVLEANSSKYGE